MTVKEAVQQLQEIWKDGYRDNAELEICVMNGKPGIGGTPATKVKSFSRGIDWDSGKVFIIMEQPMIDTEFALNRYKNSYAKFLYEKVGYNTSWELVKQALKENPKGDVAAHVRWIKKQESQFKK